MLKKLLNIEDYEVAFLHEVLKNEFNTKWLLDKLEKNLVDINYQDENGDSFLIKCIKVGKYKAAIWLIEQGIDLSATNSHNQSVLDIAMEQNSIRFVKYLIGENKMNIDYIDAEGRSLLQNVVVFGHHEIAKILIENSINMNHFDYRKRNVIYDALSFGDRIFIQYLLAFRQIELNTLDIEGNTIMQHPEVENNDEIAKDLIRFGADPSIKPTKGESYLLKKALEGEKSEDIVELALEYGTNLNSKTANDMTIMMELLAVASDRTQTDNNLRKGLLNISRKMILHGADINACEDNNESALFNAVRLRDTELVSFLLSAGIDSNIQNNQGETALSEIVYEGIEVLDIIILLLDYGADPKLRNKDGKNLFEILNILILHNYGTKQIEDKKILAKVKEEGKYISILKEVLKRIDVKEDNMNDFIDSKGDPLFFDPLLFNHFILFKLYINYGLDVNMNNKQNHNIFYEYIFHVFQDNDDSPKVLEYFQTSLSSLISQKVDKNYQDQLGWTILHKIISSTECNENIFDILIKIVKFDYSITDNLGRTIMHNCVWGNKENIAKKIALSSKNILNHPDGYGILPIVYAALLGNTKLVLLFIKLGSEIKAKQTISQSAIKKFGSMLKNLEKLQNNVEDPNDLKNIEILIEQIEHDFKT